MIVFTGATKAMRQIQAVAASGPDALVGKLYEEAEIIMTLAKTDYVPVDTGALRASGFVDPPVISGTRAEVSFGFGGPAAPYAVVVHEDLTKRHPVGQAKYLEIPFKARLAGMAAVLRQRVNDVTRQAIQRLQKIESNVKAGRSPLFGMPLFRDE